MVERILRTPSLRNNFIIWMAPINFPMLRGDAGRQLENADSLYPDMKPNYSCRNAAAGSTLIAREAGMSDAARATAISRIATPANVTGSVGLTP